MLRFPNAKINLGLFITNRREDGYHDLETVFYPLKSVQDALEVVSAVNSESRLYQTGLPVQGQMHDNLVWKAFQKLREEFPSKIPEIEIHLHKVIPMGAGLGGGSADGAFMLRLLNDAFELGLSQDRLEELALELGSDCPFFIRNTPQFAKGRGELMEPVALDLSKYEIRLVYPGVHVSTRAAFSRVVPKAAPIDLRKLPEVPVEVWKEVLRNDFEESVFVQFPEIAAAKAELYRQGAVYAAMSGSGSAVFGVFS